MKRLAGFLLILIFLPVTAFGLSFTEFTPRVRLELPLAASCEQCPGPRQNPG